MLLSMKKSWLLLLLSISIVLVFIFIKNRQKNDGSHAKHNLGQTVVPLLWFFKLIEDKLTNIVKETIYEMAVKLSVSFLFSKLCEIFKLSNYCTDLQDAATLDYYTSAVWWGKQQSFTIQQLSGFFTMVHTLFTNVKGSGLML